MFRIYACVEQAGSVQVLKVWERFAETADDAIMMIVESNDLPDFVTLWAELVVDVGLLTQSGLAA